MALIEELHRPAIGIVPIGDRLTMGGAVAALACRRFFNFEIAIPCHYGSCPIIDQTADKFVAGLVSSRTNALVTEIDRAFVILHLRRPENRCKHPGDGLPGHTLLVIG